MAYNTHDIRFLFACHRDGVSFERVLTEDTVRNELSPFGIPVSIVLTTIPFTLLHAQQVSDSWGPLLLIGLVSVVLCIVRLALNSVAAGAVVHAAYNFTLFAGVLYQTGGFRHLDKLSS